VTLKKIQEITKASLFLLVLALYGAISFFVGKVAANGTTTDVKGASAVASSRGFIENPLPSSDFQSPEIIPSAIKLCSNMYFGFEIGYESDWFTTYNTEDQKCTFFAPYAFVVPYFVDKDFTPVNLGIIEADDWLSTLMFYENPNDFYNVTSSENIEMNGKLIKKIEARTTGEGTTPRGFSIMHLLVFDGEKPIRLSYTQLDENENVDEIKSLVLNMAGSLKYF